MESKPKTIKKSRYWTAVIYPESLPADWIDQLKRSGVAGAISPLHDKDLNADNSKKKAHYHLILCYNGPTTLNAVKGLVQDSLYGALPIPLTNVNSMYRYFTHMDNPEKAQYDESDIRAFNGFAIGDYHQLTESELDSKFDLLEKIIEENQIKEYFTLNKYLKETGQIVLKRLVRKNTIHINAYIKSYRYILEEKSKEEESKKDSLG